MESLMDNEIYYHPELIFPVDEIGDLYIQWTFNHYAALRLKQRLLIFEKAYKLLTERNHFSRRRAFGEMHGDNYIWVEKCNHSKVIVQESQSFLLIYIQNVCYFHIRELCCTYSVNKTKLREVTLRRYKETNFKPSEENRGLFFSDGRDVGYILTMDTSLSNYEIDKACSDTLTAIKLMDYWEYYLNDPSQLE